MNRWIDESDEGLEIIVPIVKIAPKALADLRLFVAFCNIEISGFGKVKLHEEEMVITDLLILPQNNGRDHTILDDEAQAVFLESLAEEDNPEDYKLWWHSHVRGEATWSYTDEKTIKKFEYADFFISIVSNKWQEERVRVDFFNPVRVSYDMGVVDMFDFLAESISREAFRLLMKERASDVYAKVADNVGVVPKKDILSRWQDEKS